MLKLVIPYVLILHICHISERVEVLKFNIFITYRLLESIEILTEHLPLTDNEPFVIARNNFAVAVQEVKPDVFASKGQVISLDLGENAFDGQGLGNSTFDFNNNHEVTPPTASLALPNNLFKTLTNQNISQNSTRLTNSVFLSDSLFQRREKGYREVGSVIISAGVVGVNNVNGLTNPPVILVFQINPVSLYFFVQVHL